MKSLLRRNNSKPDAVSNPPAPRARSAWIRGLAAGAAALVGLGGMVALELRGSETAEAAPDGVMVLFDYHDSLEDLKLIHDGTTNRIYDVGYYAVNHVWNVANGQGPYGVRWPGYGSIENYVFQPVSWDTSIGDAYVSKQGLDPENDPLVRLGQSSRLGYAYGGVYWDAAYVREVRPTDTLEQDSPYVTDGVATIHFKWTPATYDVNYNLGDGAVATTNPAQYTVEDLPLALDSPTRPGYSFVGWDAVTDGTTVLGCSMGDCPGYHLPDNQLRFYNWPAYQDGQPRGPHIPNKNGGPGEPVDALDLALTDGNTIPYGTWGNVTLEARWGRLLSFDLNGSADYPTVPAAITEQAVEEGATFKNVPGWTNTPTRIGYTFTGWHLGSASGPVVTGDDTMPDEPTTLVATWTPKQYKITYQLGGGSFAATPASGYTVEDLPLKVATPARDWHNFLEWTAQGSETVNFTDGDTLAAGTRGDVVLTASWDGVESYELSFVLGTSGTPYPSTNYPSGNPSPRTLQVGRPFGTGGGFEIDPVRNGYEFAGWRVGAADGPVVTMNDPMPAEDTTLYAAWTPIEYSITYVLDGGVLNPLDPATYTVEDLPLEPPAPTRIGSGFKRWTTEIAGKWNNSGIKLGAWGDAQLEAVCCS
jgi:uncharacterized repeat protein (TIGR02543 family)